MKKLNLIFKELYPFLVYISIIVLIGCLITWLLGPFIDKNEKRQRETNGQCIENLSGNVKSLKQELYAVVVDSFVQCETQTIVFDKEGNYREKKIYDYKGNLVSTFLFQNYGLRQTAEIIQEDAEGKMIEKTLFIYNSDNFLVEKLFYNSDWHLSRKAIISYNSDLEKTSEVMLDSAGSKISEKKYFFTDGKCTLEILKSESDGTIVEIPFDNQGNPILIGDFSIEYEYDDEGSWIKRSFYANNELSMIEVRQIEYRDDE
jgi:hypothetical protein